MGRKRKSLIEKSTTLFLSIDNETLFLLCKRMNIHPDKYAEIFDYETIKLINQKIKEIVKQHVK